ncbi:unnamed protein product [Oikopleura dioica]|uniref:Serine aminopeptidase S33 domain-containing protein n=1 Tax=Oikopleura dioica TaxID=34765 RepID=E4XCR1_OIKDI|nr:unnamed protein product [Oikopleura dioica]
MNGLGCVEFCRLFLCPPCPSKIAAKVAFLPPEPSYTIVRDENGTKYKIHLSERAEWQHSAREQDQIDVFYARTRSGEKISCMHVTCSPNAKYTLLFSHGNAVDLGQMSSFFIGLGTRLKVNILSYDYCGYGQSSGKPNESNLNKACAAAYEKLLEKYSVRPDQVILYGQSIGTVPTTDLATKVDCAAVVLHSPLSSGFRVLFPTAKRTWFFDAFKNVEKVQRVRSPTLVIHGTEDEVIPFIHGKQIHDRCPKPLPPLWVNNAGHNDIEVFPEYLERLKRLINEELG